MGKTQNLFAILFDKAMVQPNGCWEYAGARYPTGYGQFTMEGKNVRAHRIAYLLCVDDIPEGLFVLHTCDNRACLNPDHLYVGTHEDNMKDRSTRNRQARHIGSTNGLSVLTEIKVKEIKLLFREGKLSNREIAEEYDVGMSTIANIRIGRTWRHV